MPRGTQVKRDGLAITVERRGTSSRIALRHPSCPRSMSCLQGTTVKERLPQRCRFQGLDSQDSQDWRCLEVPTQAPVLITPEEPWVLITVGGQSVYFLLDTGATYSWRRQWQPTPVLLPGKPHGRRSPVGCSPWGREELDPTERLHFHFSLSCIGEGNGNPLQCSCLENPRDGGAWWAAVYWVAQDTTWCDLAAAAAAANI